MPGALDAELIAEAVALIDELGAEMRWREWTRDGLAYDTTTASQPGSSTDWDIVATPPIDYEKKYVGGRLSDDSGGQLILDGDARVFIAAGAVTFKPKPGDEALFDVGTADEQLWACLGVKEYRSGRRVALYEAHLRRRG